MAALQARLARIWHRGAVLSGTGACASALWLVPASVHIVDWPATGPHRLGLLAPNWHLLVLGAVGAVLALLALAMAWRRREWDGVERLGRATAPLSWLWLWTVPFLPWIPDRFPLLLVLAGPLRWVVAAGAVGAALLAAGAPIRLQDAWSRIGRRTVFAMGLAVYAGAGLYSARSVGPGGDEPHYLVIVESLIRDGDLQIENNHVRGDYRAFWPGELRPDYFVRGQNGAIYSIHAPGLPVLALPAYAAAGRLGVVALMAILAALTALAVFDAVSAVAPRPAAGVAWAGACLTVPFIPHAWMIFPELPGALIVAWAVRWMLQPGERPAAVWVWRGAALGALPWLHTKFVVFVAIFGVGLALRVWRRPRLLLALGIPTAASVGLWLYSFFAIYGVVDPEAPYGAYTAIYVLTRNIPHGVLGLLFDQKFGLLVYSPLYLLAIPGAWMMLARRETRVPVVVLLGVVGAFVGSTARLYMFWGGSSAPARFLVPLVPCLAPMVAVAVARWNGVVGRAFTGLWLSMGIAVATVGTVWPNRFLLFSDPHGHARMLQMIEAASPLTYLVPTFTEPDWAGQVVGLLVWAAVSGGATWVALWYGRAYRPSAWSVASVACVTFLLAGSLMSARVTADGREEVAQRGDIDVMWTFDGTRLRTLDYQTLKRTTPTQLRELSTIVTRPADGAITDGGYTFGPITVPAGRYTARVWFANNAAREGDVIVSGVPEVVFGSAQGRLQNPTDVIVDLPVSIRRLLVRIPDPRIARDVIRLELVPEAVLVPGERETAPVRAVETLTGDHPGYLVYTDEHAYPERGVFWSRGTAETTVLVAPQGATRMTLTLSTGPMSGAVTIAVGTEVRQVAMAGGAASTVSFDVPPMARLVPVRVQSTTMFRPAEMNSRSSDTRGLGCQVRIRLE